MTVSGRRASGMPVYSQCCYIAKSIASETSTLYEAKDNKKTDSTKGTTTKGDTLGASSTAFAKKAKEQGWAAPTATRPSFGW